VTQAQDTETRGGNAPGSTTPSDECAGCTHERMTHNHPDAGQCTEIVDFYRYREPLCCPCEGFTGPEDA
jgi:hypothetical protein